MKMTKLEKKLRKGLEFLSVANSRWCQFDYFVKDGVGRKTIRGADSACILGACGFVRSTNCRSPDDAVALALLSSIRVDDPEALGVSEWNDDPTREYKDVIRVMQRALEQALKGKRAHGLSAA